MLRPILALSAGVIVHRAIPSSHDSAYSATHMCVYILNVCSQVVLSCHSHHLVTLVDFQVQMDLDLDHKDQHEVTYQHNISHFITDHEILNME